MLKNYLLTALRNVRKQKVFAAINVVGLAVGIALCVLLFLFVRDELTFDRFHANGDRIVRVTTQSVVAGSVAAEMPWQPMPLAPALKADLPEIEETVRFFEEQVFVRRGDATFEERMIYADPGIFEVFTFPLRHGDPATALAEPNSIVLSEAAARKYFGDEDPMGRTMQVRQGATFSDVVVTGVAAPIPGNSSIRFDYLMPFSKLPDAYEWIRNRQDRWTVSSFYVYALLREQASPEAVQAKLPAFRARYLPDEAAGTGEGPVSRYRLQPIGEIHLDPSVMAGLTPPSDPTYSYILSGIALAILLIACINFTTLAIGRSAARAKEVGVRKVVGAQRRQLMVQFWSEALLMSVLALIAGAALAELFLPTFNALAGKQLRLDLVTDWTIGTVLAGLVLLVGLLAGGYPALVLSGIRPMATLQRRFRLGRGGLLTRSLVVVQFTLSVALIIGTLAMMQQMQYLQTKHLGFDKEQVVVIPSNDQPAEVVLARFRQDLGGRPDVLGITGISSSFTRGWSREGWDYRGEEKRAYTYRVETNFLDVMGMDLVTGRNLDPNLATDSTQAVLVNEALVRDFGWTEPIGQKLEGFYAEPLVVGVVRDIHFRSLHEAVEPMVLTLDPDWGMHHVLVRIAPGGVPGMLDALRDTWQQIAPEVPFQYSFLDDDLARQYESEQRWIRIVGYGALFAILIACLGLFGLASLAVAGRTKEIGIRKVLGASATGVALLLSKDFARLVLVALVLAAPLAYYALQRWLDGFAYHITLGAGLFLGTAVLVLVVALVTVAYHTLRAALVDPVQSLRYE